MNDRTYPYRAWLLTREYQPLEIELVGRGYIDSAHDRTESGRNHPIGDLFPTKAAAVADGEQKLAALAVELARKLAHVRKRRLVLERHR